MIHSLAISGNNLFTGTNGGVFLSTDNGDSWNEKNSGLSDSLIFSLAISEDSIFAGSYCSGVARANTSSLISSILTKNNENCQNIIYPNPTINVLNLYFDNIMYVDLPQIEIYSVLGKEIILPKQVINGNNVQLDVSSIQQGIYFINVFVDNNHMRLKFIKVD